MPRLECAGVSKAFGGLQALDGVTFHIDHAGIVALIGPNGAGKTTLLNVLTGLMPPDSGRILIDDADVTRIPAQRRAQVDIARTFQEVRVFRNMTVADNLRFAHETQDDEGLLAAFIHPRARPDVERRTDESLTRIGLGPVANALASDLSYGQQKILAVESCVTRRKPICLLDEPVSGLDASARTQIVNVMRGRAGAGQLVMFVEHDLALVSALADYIVVMDAGKIIAQGTPDTVLSDKRVIEAYLA